MFPSYTLPRVARGRGGNCRCRFKLFVVVLVVELGLPHYPVKPARHMGGGLLGHNGGHRDMGMVEVVYTAAGVKSCGGEGGAEQADRMQ